MPLQSPANCVEFEGVGNGPSWTPSRRIRNRITREPPDGNKRIALILMFTFLAINGYVLAADQDETADMMLAVAEAPTDKAAMDMLLGWLPSHVTAVEDQG